MTQPNFQKEQLAFMQACGQETYTLLDWIESQNKEKRARMVQALRLYWRLIDEEFFKELTPNFQLILTRYEQTDENPHTNLATIELLSRLGDDVIDTFYVLMGFANTLGLPVAKIWQEVQASNMAKRDKDGKVIKRPDGKILKPEGWKPPNIEGIVRKEIAYEQNVRAPWQARLIESAIKLHKASRQYETLDMHIKNGNLAELKKWANEVAEESVRIKMILANRLIEAEKAKDETD